MLKGISGNKHTSHFVLYNQDRRYHPLRSIINRLPTDGQRQFITDEYTVESGHTYPCISRSASGESTDSMGEAVWGACTPVTRWSRHTHTIAPSTPSTRGIPHCLLTNCSHPAPPPVPTRSSSQVVHCRVCPPHPLHAPVLVLHLTVYPASPTHGRVGLTDRLPHSAQTHRNLTR